MYVNPYLFGIAVGVGVTIILEIIGLVAYTICKSDKGEEENDTDCRK